MPLEATSLRKLLLHIGQVSCQGALGGEAALVVHSCSLLLIAMVAEFCSPSAEENEDPKNTLQRMGLV